MMKKLIPTTILACAYCCLFAQQPDSVTIAAFTADTTGFRKFSESVYVNRTPFKYKRAQRRRIRNIEDVVVWYVHNSETGSNLQEPEYKEVAGGWLLVGEYLEPGYWAKRERDRHIRKYFVGRNHCLVLLEDDLFEYPAEWRSHITIDSLSYKFSDGVSVGDMAVEPKYLCYDGDILRLCHDMEQRINFVWDLHHDARFRVKGYVWPQYPVTGRFSHAFTIDSLGQAPFKGDVLVSDTISWYAVESILPKSVNSVICSPKTWSAGTVNGRAVPVEMSITVSCTIDRNPEYDKWPHYTWRELLDRQRQNEQEQKDNGK